MGHEVRHTAQRVQMIRLLGHTPPSLNRVFVLGR
ncbi:Yfit/DinB family protein [Deinococcus gobiensis I-0]|uniref:Yfit/DinB family protein n=2 Tax=Deinococcus TaxID=1298 RepID=H8GUB4_DEIGI|nr:Yfit/DinB family protein [Deinococcus gobiensis I-0]